MKKTCVDCGEHEALPEDELCQECRNDMDEIYQRTKVYEIPWQKYDPENPPKEGTKYLISDGKNTDFGYHYIEEDEMYWIPNDLSRVKGVTHWAPINLPGEE